MSSAGGGTGGSTPFTTSLASTITVSSTTLSTPQMPSHTHAVSIDSGGSIGAVSIVNVTNRAYDPFYSFYPNTYTNGLYTQLLQSTGGSGSHNHTFNLNVNYVDVIICEKD